MLHLLLCGLRRTPPEPVAKGLQLTAIVTTQPTSVRAMPEQRGACVKEIGDSGSVSQKMSTSSEDTMVDDQVHCSCLFTKDYALIAPTIAGRQRCREIQRARSSSTARRKRECSQASFLFLQPPLTQVLCSSNRPLR
jgi:hypothetical protein